MIAAVALAVYFVALFAATRLMPAHEWDGWWVWTIRAKAIYYDGDLGDAGLVLGSVYPSYPPGLSVLYAGALESMGAVDMVTLHLQNWFLALGFSTALLVLFADRVRVWISLPAVVLVTTLPALTEQAPLFHADALLAYEIAIAVVLLLLWLDDEQRWRCAAASLHLGVRSHAEARQPLVRDLCAARAPCRKLVATSLGVATPCLGGRRHCRYRLRVVDRPPASVGRGGPIRRRECICQ